MDSSFDQAVDVAALLLRNHPHPPIDVIREMVAQTLRMFPAEASRTEDMVRILESRFNVRIGAVNELLSNANHRTWLPAKRSTIQWPYWKRYETYLLRDKGWSPSVVERLDESIDKVLGFLEDPEREGAWDRRGLVVGHVQSGKTSNYTGLICKAADAGYKLIVVLAGVHNSLRSQTQLRLDEGFLGFDSLELQKENLTKTPIGVSRIDSTCQIPNTITNRSEQGDFSTAVARQFGITPGGKPLLFVVKKNPTVLRNLLNWVLWAAPGKDETTGRPIVTGIPLLVIDDEADYASVDTKLIPRDEYGQPARDHDPTTINKRIRQLLHSFEKAAYVGYTATPFANTYIHEGAYTNEHGMDLFPRGFIVNLPAPSNYVGPARVFGLDADPDSDRTGQEGLPIIRRVNDFGEWMPNKHKKGYIPGPIPASLKQAIRAFVLTCAARLARGQDAEHNSMLIHVTRFTDVQERVSTQVKDELKNITRRLRLGDGNASDQIVQELKSLWERDFVPTTQQINIEDCPPIAWHDVAAQLEIAASRIEVRTINGTAGDVLDYADQAQQALSVVAIGGDKLSRGLTLEGLSVSYYLRASRMYDTLMQMGRWFGFRPGYLDLCRLYTSDDLVEWYEHITMANEELRELFDYMAAARATPEDFGLRVRCHPDLLVTGQVKMRNGHKIALSFSGDISETIGFHRDAATIEKNYEATSDFLRALGAPSERKAGETSTLIWRQVNGERITDEFLSRMTVHPIAKKVRVELLCAYIGQRTQAAELTQWTVALVSSSSGKPANIAGHDIGLAERSHHPKDVSPEELGRYGVRRLVNPTDEAIDLSKSQHDRALEMTREFWRAGLSRSKDEPTAPNGTAIRQIRDKSNGLLLIYPLDATSHVECSLPVIGFAVSFPRSDLNDTVDYVVNNVFFEQEFADE